MKSTHVAILACLFGLLLSFQGWRAGYNPFDYDGVIPRDGAHDLVHEGRIPVSSGLTTLGVYLPPGSALLYVPGMLVGSPQLYQLTGGAFLFVIAVLGVFFLTRRCSDETTAALAATLYSLSWLGLYFGSSLWPVARPAPYIWMLLFTVLWVEKRNVWYLAGVIVVYSMGNYVSLQMVPAILMPAVVFWRYRPPLRLAPILVALAVALFVWYPYLQFEIDREFVDLKSFITLQRIGPDGTERLDLQSENIGTWDDQSESLIGYQKTPADPPPSLAKRVFFRTYHFASTLGANVVKGNPLGILLMPFLFGAAVAYLSYRYGIPRLLDRPFVRWLGWTTILVALLSNEWVAAELYGKPLDSSEALKIRLLQVGIFAVGCLLIFGKRIAPLVERTESMFGISSLDKSAATPMRVCITCVVLMWIVFGILATVGRYQYGIWPLQVILISLLVMHVPKHAAWPKWTRGLSLAVVALCIVPNAKFIGKAQDWAQNGFGGEKHETILAADEAVARFRGLNSESLRIGYLLFFNGWEYTSFWADKRYRIGGPIDQYIRFGYGVQADNAPPEGTSAEDQFRIVETTPRGNKLLRFRFSDKADFELVKSWNTVELWQKVELPGG